MNGSRGAFPYDRLGDPACVALLPEVPQDPGELLRRIGVEDVGGGRPGRRVHPHVQRHVAAVGEAAVALVELEGGDAEVEQHTVDLAEPEPVEDRWKCVVHLVHEGDTPLVVGEPGTGGRQGLRVAVDTDELDLREFPQQGGRMATEAQSRVDHDSARAGQGRREKFDHAVCQDWYMDRVVSACVHRNNTLESATVTTVEAPREKAMTASLARTAPETSPPGMAPPVTSS